MEDEKRRWHLGLRAAAGDGTLSPVSPDARLARAALAALQAATTDAVAVAADLPPDRALAALDELRAAGDARRDDDGTWRMTAGLGRR